MEKRIKSKSKILTSLMLVIVILFSITACGGSSYTCSNCKNEFKGTSYYDMTPDNNRVMCSDCAQKYWMPLDYRTYKAN